ncbi:tRNA (adenosine(37)-N6)-dimethylallyltransferase MiaA [Aerococcus urinaeequi]|uniref:tRNA (adenosine(37)-N6)-dimethylallyltransferase MiaA n=1 Tax=Aerococcus sp. HMSC10H05 TaxID=1581084 RepID=UPI0008A1D9E2|nr:tRNA (adenosine(37)-N6)-dimethylallyltransferase MiaA [Aerococcus sp. HMSC10H05]OFU48808.1 tRNA dimethylallyltransferase [Aerococcus sp. HMSC10H05]
MKPKLIVIAGPTGVGKTSLSLKLAKAFNGEIINGDSMQIYKSLDVGTATPTKSEQAEAVHHLISYVRVDEEYSVSRFKSDAKAAMEDILAKGKIPILVGGTGLYLESFIYDLSLGGDNLEHPKFRTQMEKLAKNEGNQVVYQKLVDLDPKAAEQIHPNNLRRVIRALEVGTFSDKLFSDQSETHDNHVSPYDLCIIALNTDRQVLYDRINKRVDDMVNQGLVEESKWLLSQNLDKNQQSMKAIGYKELFPYIRGEISLDIALEDLKQNSRRYAKRQITWIKNRLTDVHWVDLVAHPQDLQDLLKLVDDFLNTTSVH